MQGLQSLITMIKYCSFLWSWPTVPNKYWSYQEGKPAPGKPESIFKSLISNLVYSEQPIQSYIWKEKYNCAQCQSSLYCEKSKQRYKRKWSKNKTKLNNVFGLVTGENLKLWCSNSEEKNNIIIFHSHYI